jgi:hypothetical protein
MPTSASYAAFLPIAPTYSTFTPAALAWAASWSLMTRHAVHCDPSDTFDCVTVVKPGARFRSDVDVLERDSASHAIRPAADGSEGVLMITEDTTGYLEAHEAPFPSLRAALLSIGPLSPAALIRADRKASRTPA